MFLEIFDRVYIINLKSREDRRKQVARELERIEISVDHDRIKFFEAVRPEDAGGFPSIGARGCFCSHLEVLKRAEKESTRAFLILEDDVVFSSAFMKAAPGVAADLKTNPWDIFYGYGAAPAASENNGACAVIPPENNVIATHCIGFKTERAQTIYRYLEAMMARPGGSSEGGPMHVDGAYSWFRRAHPDLITLAPHTEMAQQGASRSDITRNSPLETLPVIRDAVKLARRIRRRIS